VVPGSVAPGSVAPRTVAPLEPASEARRLLAAALRQRLADRGHRTDLGRAALGELEAALAGPLGDDAPLAAMVADLRRALDAGPGGRLGAKSGEAAQRILRALVGYLEAAEGNAIPPPADPSTGRAGGGEEARGAG
jgi:hypothetical protein